MNTEDKYGPGRITKQELQANFVERQQEGGKKYDSFYRALCGKEIWNFPLYYVNQQAGSMQSKGKSTQSSFTL